MGGGKVPRSDTEVFRCVGRLVSSSRNLLVAVFGGTRGGSCPIVEESGCSAGASVEDWPPAKLKPPGGAWMELVL